MEDVIILAATPTGGTPTITTRIMMIAMTIRTIIIGTAAGSSCRNSLLVETSAFGQAPVLVEEVNRESVAVAPPSTDGPLAVSGASDGMGAIVRNSGSFLLRERFAG
jgi:hypothetical protein